MITVSAGASDEAFIMRVFFYPFFCHLKGGSEVVTSISTLKFKVIYTTLNNKYFLCTSQCVFAAYIKAKQMKIRIKIFTVQIALERLFLHSNRFEANQQMEVK